MENEKCSKEKYFVCGELVTWYQNGIHDNTKKNKFERKKLKNAKAVKISEIENVHVSMQRVEVVLYWFVVLLVKILFGLFFFFFFC